MSAPVIADASVLILLAKIQQIHVLHVLYGAIIIGGTVYDEVVEDGRRIGAREVVLVEQAIGDGWLRQESRTPDETAFSDSLRATTRLHAGEAEAIAMARSRNALLLVDDKEARSVAQALGIARIGTAGILLEAYLRRGLTLSELEDAVGNLASVSWQSPEVTALVLKRARENT